MSWWRHNWTVAYQSPAASMGAASDINAGSGVRYLHHGSPDDGHHCMYCTKMHANPNQILSVIGCVTAVENVSKAFETIGGQNTLYIRCSKSLHASFSDDELCKLVI